MKYIYELPKFILKSPFEEYKYPDSKIILNYDANNILRHARTTITLRHPCVYHSQRIDYNYSDIKDLSVEKTFEFFKTRLEKGPSDDECPVFTWEQLKDIGLIIPD